MERSRVALQAIPLLSFAAANAVDMRCKPGDFAVQHCVPAEEEAHVRVYTPWVDFSKTGASA